ncbi:2-dehydropantoate 2-reductase family [Talaromyces proteolyticus]|uniref:2-dehydropantoate 2-reductase n=1 Tax=Talaromyces proteolyticus TaxID=1131652 RepID=A0AAD4KK71_9EURO|nr:2-dehydropantoate 2-reductase family [Talaromyces proteolyticus]KAH8690124.1 2-dehydropantoate 2-reductase family [Talaromyces proteolyticus]
MTPPKYQICLIGSGGVGTIASIVLTKSGLGRVTAVLRSKYSYVSQHGWQIESIDHGKLLGWKPYRLVSSVNDAATDENGEQIEYDYVVVCTKQLPNKSPVTDMISPVITPSKTTVVMIQNGIGIENDIIKMWPKNAVMSSVSHIGSSIKEPNVVIQMGKDVSKMGPHFHDGLDDSESTEKARAFVNMYVMGGSSVTEFVDDIQVARWEKLLWNGTFNTICALMRMDVGEVQRSKGRETLLVPMMWEIWRIASSAGHHIPESIISWMAYRLPDDCDYRPSMLLDLENGRHMELEVILGNPLKLAKELGVDTPIMATVYKFLKLEEWKIDQKVLPD